MTIVCGDCHTSTHGAFGALAHGIGTSEVEHVLATQTLIQKKAKNMRVTVDGRLPAGVTAKDIILVDHRRDRHRRRHRPRHRVCRRGDPRALDGRPHDGLQHVDRGRRPRRHVAPDEKTFAYLKDRPKAPKGAAWDAAVRYWETLRSDEGAHFDAEIRLDAANLPPIVTWGTSPEDVVSVEGAVPNPDEIADENKRALEVARARLYGPQARHQDHRHRPRPGVHRLLHQRPHRGPARGRPGRRGQAGRTKPSTR